MAGEPVFAGTRIPLALIAKGVARDEIPRIIRRSAAPISISRRSTPRRSAIPGARANRCVSYAGPCRKQGATRGRRDREAAHRRAPLARAGLRLGGAAAGERAVVVLVGLGEGAGGYGMESGNTPRPRGSPPPRRRRAGIRVV